MTNHHHPTTRRRVIIFLSYLLPAGCSFLLGRLASTLFHVHKAFRVADDDLHKKEDVFFYMTHDGHTHETFFSHHHQQQQQQQLILQQQIQDQQMFQSLLHASQNPMDCTYNQKFLVRNQIPAKDGFASELQYIARSLQSALSTERILLITKDWTSAYCGASSRQGKEEQKGWTCLWQPISNCTETTMMMNTGAHRQTLTNQSTTMMDTFLHPMSFSILPRKYRSMDRLSRWFDPLPYSSRPILPAPVSFPLKYSSMVMDVIPHWERVYGRYWIRSQLVHYLWQPSEQFQKEIQYQLQAPAPPTTTISSSSLLPSTPFIGLHIRYTDNIPDLAKGFGRNATWTRRLERFLGIAEQICHYYNYHSKHVFIATDHSMVVDWARQVFTPKGWTIASQENRNVQRSTTRDRIWFAQGRSMAASGMAVDLEILRRADYLIGSFQSNVFRLAAQLNTAWHVGKYSCHQPRHFSVDVEWFEDP